MKRINAFITAAQFFFLATLSGTLSEHIRRALDDYIQKIKEVSVSASQSKRKEEKDNG